MRKRKEPLFDNRKKGLKIALINPFGIGDVIFSTPLIQILKETLPEARLYYICNKRTYQVLEKCPMLERVFVFEKGDYKSLWKRNKFLFFKEIVSFLRDLKEEHFDAMIDMSMGHQYGLVFWFLGVPERIGFDYKKRGRFHTRKLAFDGFDDKPIGDYYKDLLGLTGLDLIGDAGVKIWWSADDEARIDDFFKKEGLLKGDLVIGVAPGGGVSFGPRSIAFKRWPWTKFAELSDRLIREAGAKVVLICGPGEEDLAKGIAEIMDNRLLIAPETSIREMAVLMSKCECVVTNDAGPLHVAVASGARTVSVFGPSDENVYGPYPRNPLHATVTKEIHCRPCYKKFKIPDCGKLDCLNTLEVREVLTAVEKQIKVVSR